MHAFQFAQGQNSSACVKLRIGFRMCGGKADDVLNTSVRFREAATQKAKAQPIRLHAKSLVSAKIDLRCRFVNYNPVAFREIFVCIALDPCNVDLKLMF